MPNARVHAPISVTPWRRPALYFGVLFVFSTAMRLSALWHHDAYGDTNALIKYLDTVLGIFSFYGSLFAFSFLLLVRWTSTVRRRIAIFGLRIVVLVLLILEVVEWNLLYVTGGHLDVSLLIFALLNAGHLAPVVASESGPGIALLGGILILLWFADRHLVSDSESSHGSSLSSRSRLAITTVAIVLAAVASKKPITDTGRLHARATAINLGLSARPSRLVSDRYISKDAIPMPSSAGVFLTKDDTLPTSAEDANLVFIILESFRADWTTPYAPDLDTTPYLASLARDSLVAEHAYAIVPHTSKALVLMLCGVYPYLEYNLRATAEGAIPSPCLPRLLAQQGYSTAFFQSARLSFEDRLALLRRMGFAEGWGGRELSPAGSQKLGYFGYPDSVMVEPGLRWADQHRDGPFMMTFLTVATHHPYDVPDSFKTTTTGGSTSADHYRRALRYVDGVVGSLMRGFERLGMMDNTVFFVVGDHGEGFGEHGRYQHDLTIYNEGLHVPLLIRLPGRARAGERLQERINHLDLLPTAVQLLGYRIEGGEMPGRALFGDAGGIAERDLFAYCFYTFRCAALIRGRFKFIHHFDAWPDELFDLEADPREQVDLSAKLPELSAELRRATIARLTSIRTFNWKRLKRRR